MKSVLPAIIILCIITVAALALLAYLWSKKKAAGETKDDGSANSSDTFFKAVAAVAIVGPLLIILLVVFGLSENGSQTGNQTGEANAPEAPADPNNAEADPAEAIPFEPLTIKQMTYRELRRHNLMLMEWIRTCDDSGTGVYMLSTKYDHNGDTIREMLLYRNDGGYSVELMPDDETFPDPEGVYFRCVSEGNDKNYTIAYYSFKESPANPGPCYIIQGGEVIELSDSGWGGNPETLFPLTINFERKDDMAYELFNNKTGNIGDNSAVGGLLEALNCREFGPYEIALKTDAPPFRLTVDYSSVDLSMEKYHKYEEPSLHDFTAVLFALIDNAGEIEWTIDGEQAVLYKREQFDEEYGGSIGAYGESEDKFLELWRQLDI